MLNVDPCLPNRSFGGSGAPTIRSDWGISCWLMPFLMAILRGFKFALDDHKIVCGVNYEDESFVLNSTSNVMLILWHIPLQHSLYLNDENVSRLVNKSSYNLVREGPDIEMMKS